MFVIGNIIVEKHIGRPKRLWPLGRYRFRVPKDAGVDKTYLVVLEYQELADYPYLSYEQGEHNSFYFSEEIFSSFERKKNIRVSDRATLFNLLIGLNGYTVCSGIIDQKLNGEDIIAVPLADEGDMRIGYVTHRKGMISRLGETYLEALKKYITGEQSV